MEIGTPTVRQALVRLLGSNPRAAVLDPASLPSLLAAELGPEAATDDLVRATLLGPRTGALRGLAASPPSAAAHDLHHELRAAGVPDELAERAARLWADALAEVPEPGAATVTIVDQPLAPPAAPPSPASRPDGRTAGRTAPDAATTPADSSRSRRPSGALLLLGALALIAAVAAVLGWSRDPSKDRAVSAETQVQELEASLAKSGESLATTEAELGRRTTELTAAKAQLAATGSIVRAQFAGASLPQKFSLTGGVAPGSCTLTGEACTVATTVRNITLSCTGATCECAAGSCTVTSDLWKTAAPVAYDAATGLYTAKGNLDADLFRCAGVPQPTTFELRFRVTKITWSSTTWVANGLEAELAQASSASDCLAGNRTYALSGPAA